VKVFFLLLSVDICTVVNYPSAGIEIYCFHQTRMERDQTYNPTSQ